MNEEIIFAPGGNALSFLRLKFPFDLPEYLKNFGLNGYEFEFGRGARISGAVSQNFKTLAETHKIYPTFHAPYFISLSSENEETRLKSVDYLLSTARIAHQISPCYIRPKIVVHSGSCANMSRGDALSLAKDTLKRCRESLIENGFERVIICPETMGKTNQLGDLSEVIELCKDDENFIPCIDFGHLNARSFGGIKTKADYEKIFDELSEKLSFDRVKHLHIHFSKIMYTRPGGEKKHLNFCDDYGQFDLDYKPLLEVIKERGYIPSIVCESAGMQTEDASEMHHYELTCNV